MLLPTGAAEGHHDHIPPGIGATSIATAHKLRYVNNIKPSNKTGELAAPMLHRD
jgi:hypothetical protein